MSSSEDAPAPDGARGSGPVTARRGRALATEPKLLILDEVMAGLRPTEVDEMVKILKALRDSGMTIFIIEHIMRAVMALSDWIVVIHFGRKISEGTPKEVASDEKVIKAYLGDDYGVS